MKYWEAMLKGSKLRPQAFKSVFDEQGSCALGAIYEGMFGTNSLISCSMNAWTIADALSLHFGKQSCPVCSIDFHLGTTIWHLNDVHGWSRENIAYYLREIEEPFYRKVGKQEETKHELVGV